MIGITGSVLCSHSLVGVGVTNILSTGLCSGATETYGENLAKGVDMASGCVISTSKTARLQDGITW